MNRKVTASLLILAAVLANVGFTALGSIFNYPDVLNEPAGTVLASFRENQGAVSLWFTILALSAALFAPIAIGVGKLSPHKAMRIAVPVGIAAAVVQVIGLMRWPLLVPGYASDAGSANMTTASKSKRVENFFITILLESGLMLISKSFKSNVLGLQKNCWVNGGIG